MEEILKKYNYKPTENNTWVKGDWTVRFDNELVEVFNDPDINAGEYYCSPIERANLEEILLSVEKKNRGPILKEINNMITKLI